MNLINSGCLETEFETGGRSVISCMIEVFGAHPVVEVNKTSCRHPNPGDGHIQQHTPTLVSGMSPSKSVALLEAPRVYLDCLEIDRWMTS